VDADSVTVTYSYVGYRPQTIRLKLRKDTTLTVALNTVILKEVQVNAYQAEGNPERTQMSAATIPVGVFQKVPTLMGESDVFKVLQLLPGVQGGNEGSSGLYVRGGGPDQNLILMDGVPVYSASHLYGFFSTFNADAINHVELVKGGFPARYGGRLSSVVDIRMKEGNASQYHGQLGIGIIASRILLEGPLKKGKTSFLLSARRSYLNLLNSSIFQTSDAGNADNYHFYDINAKVNHKFNARNRVYFSLYIGQDKTRSETENGYVDSAYTLTLKSDANISWGNAIAALQWNHVINKRLFSNFSAALTHYRFRVLNETSSERQSSASTSTEDQFYRYDYESGIRDYSVQADFDFIPNRFHYFRFGVHAIYHQFTPGVLAVSSSQSTNQQDASVIDAGEFSGYIEDDWRVNQRIGLNVGLRVTTFLVDRKSYPSLQPRISARYLIFSDLAIKASFATMQQNVHLLSNSGIGIPTDLWVPATGSIRPQTSQQVAIGLVYNLPNDYEVQMEGYYKTMANVIEYGDGASYLDMDQNWQNKVESGSGEGYGIELFMQKKVGRVSGWVGYTLSWAYRTFPNLNQGKPYPYRYDRRHDAKVVLSYEVGDQLSLGLVWVYGTGNAVSVPLEMYQGEYTVESFDSSTPVIWHYGDRNGFRMRAYHRLDLSANYSILAKRVVHRFTLSIYNAYARKNPYYLQFGYHENRRSLIQENLFSVLPSLTYSIRF
jgi:outer membrane receptor for ferrienterochelin and colicin